MEEIKKKRLDSYMDSMNRQLGKDVRVTFRDNTPPVTGILRELHKVYLNCIIEMEGGKRRIIRGDIIKWIDIL